MKYTYLTNGTCSRQIDIELDGEIIKSIQFHGGCNGNANGISALTRGMSIDHVIEVFEGVRCGMKRTSCPDQLAQALKEAKNK